MINPAGGTLHGFMPDHYPELFHNMKVHDDDKWREALMRVRALTPDFMYDLKAANGVLNPILERVKQDHTLMLAIRQNYINIYYRGGNILKVNEHGNHIYQASFDDQYNVSGKSMPDLPGVIKCQADALKWVGGFSHLKEFMDFYFAVKGKSEREFQQLVARENNNSSISNESEYFVADIEFTDPGNARFDMLAVRWDASQRKNGSKCRAALMEMKYGDGALGGKAGLLKHIKDIDAVLSDKEKSDPMLEVMENQFNQLDELGLLNYNRGVGKAKVRLVGNKPEVIFILANHNPRSKTLCMALADPEFAMYDQNERYDIRFFISSFSGYGLHTNCMLTLNEFRELLKSGNNKSKNPEYNQEDILSNLQERVKLLEKSYNPDDLDLHFNNLIRADADSALFEALLFIGLEAWNIIKNDQTRHNSYWFYNYLLLICGGSLRVLKDNSQTNISRDVIERLGVLLVEISTMTNNKNFQGDITKRNFEALVNLLSAFNKHHNLESLLKKKAKESHNKDVEDFLKIAITSSK